MCAMYVWDWGIVSRGNHVALIFQQKRHFRGDMNPRPRGQWTRPPDATNSTQQGRHAAAMRAVATTTTTTCCMLCDRKTER